MSHPRSPSLVLWCGITAIWFAFAGLAVAVPVVWTGPTITFAKTGSDNPSLPQYQDRLTNNVSLTRGSNMGLYNVAKESGYLRFSSPADTEWATAAMPENSGKTIAASNWQQLMFTTWADSFGGSGILGDNITDFNAVVHLLTDDIYLDLSFTQFDSGGLMAYQRSSAAATIVPTGDYNDNGVVDAADYVLWRSTLDDTVSTPGDGADGSGNGVIDAEDYQFWRARFGNVVSMPGQGSARAVAVPEPACLLALFYGTGLLCAWYRRPRTQRYF